MNKPDFIMEVPEVEPNEKPIATPDLIPLKTPELRRAEPKPFVEPKPVDTEPIAKQMPEKMAQHTEIIYDRLPSEALQWIKPQQKKKGHFALLPNDEHALDARLQKDAGVTAEYSKEIKTKDRKSVPDVTLTKDNQTVCKVHFKLYNKKDEFNQALWYVHLFFYDYSNETQMSKIKDCMISFFKGHDSAKALPKALPQALPRAYPKVLPKALPKVYPKALHRSHSTKKNKHRVHHRNNHRQKLTHKHAQLKRQPHVA
jgi:hypothetical protein